LRGRFARVDGWVIAHPRGDQDDPCEAESQQKGTIAPIMAFGCDFSLPHPSSLHYWSPPALRRIGKRRQHREKHIMALPPTIPRHLHRGQQGELVRQIQEMLNLAGARPQLPPTGQFGDLTDQAVRYFQSRTGLTVDGIVDTRTFAALGRAIQTRNAAAPTVHPTAPVGTSPIAEMQQNDRSTKAQGSAASGAAPGAPDAGTPDAMKNDSHVIVAPGAISEGSGGFCFPLAQRPTDSWHVRPRCFGCSRSNGSRLHAACDLYARPGTLVYAIADGTLFRAERHFYLGVNEVSIRHGNFIVRYGEIMPGSYVGGKTVRKGQPIAKVGYTKALNMSMLHFEMYENAERNDELTQPRAPYRRRSDLINPTKYLDEWVKHLPTGR
jgi:murein DD-endopeptidase MepM/ murein hydrolase activator NlpD